jgi:hypothetical protein
MTEATTPTRPAPVGDWKAKEAARAAMAAALQAANPHLVPVDGKVDSLQAAAKNIRTELARAFPGVKFSVKSRRFSGGDAIDVKWTDGPMSAQVDEIINRYSAGSFDGMVDLYTYDSSAWGDAFGSAKYVHSVRDYSDAAIESAIRTVFAKYAGNLSGINKPSTESWRRGQLWNVPMPHMNDDLGTFITRELSRRTWALSKAPAAPALELEAA